MHKFVVAACTILAASVTTDLHIASAQEPDAVLQCMDSTIVDGRIRLTHVIEGTGDVISRDEWVMRCQGTAALRAWDQLFLFRKDEPTEEVRPDGARALILKFGVGSRCAKLTRSPDGTPGNQAVCDISIDILPQIQSGVLH